MRSLPAPLQEDARSRWQAVGEAFAQKGLPLPDSGTRTDALVAGLALSDFVLQQAVRWPGRMAELLESGDLFAAYGPDGHGQRLDGMWQARFDRPLPEWADGSAPPVPKDALMEVLRSFRQREMVRIALRDLCAWADLEETLADLSALADVAIAAALAALYRQQAVQWGVPLDRSGNAQQMVVIGLGKLGARELNFSSDVDLLFAYARDGQTSGGSKGAIANEAFFTRVCRELIQVVGKSTADGFVFRVDVRLRPYGDAGPLVMSFDRMEDYYQEQGREWERYALIKARVVAGAQADGEQLLARLRPFIFRRYLDYGAFDSLRDMKARIAGEVRRKGLAAHIKLGPGGIREIEFFGQMFQLIRGGVDADLQVRPIRQVLAVLVRKNYIPALVGEVMDQAYGFLRRVENRLQAWADQQTHSLPREPMAQLRLAAAMGFDDWEAFAAQLAIHRRQVRSHFNELLASDKEQPSVGDPEKETLKQLEAIWRGAGDTDRTRRLLSALGYQSPSAVMHQIAGLKEDRALQTLNRAGRERLNRLLPMVLQAVGAAQQPDLVLGRVFDLLRGIQRRSSYFALLLENPATLTHLVQLVGASPWIAKFLSGHPVLLDELLDPRNLYRPPLRREMEAELAQRLAAVEADDLEYQMEVLRVFKQVNVLRVAASDITHVLPLMKVSDHLSDIAEVVIEAVVDLCFQQLAAKYGRPACNLAGGRCERGFAVIAYGKLGGLELGYQSDLDLVFLHAAEQGSTAGGARSLDNAQFFARLGQRVLHMLTTPTGAGVLYDADMRLRPSGASGMLVSHVEGFGDYQRGDAWTWEHQALIRARAISGDPALQERFSAIRNEILTRRRDPQRLRQEVADMRRRLRQEHARRSPSRFDLKQGEGGIVDIEFIVQYLVLKHAHRHPRIVRWTDNVRLLQALSEAGVLHPETAFGLRRAYLIYRAMVHRFNLGQQPAEVADDRFPQTRRFVGALWQRLFRQDPR